MKRNDTFGIKFVSKSVKKITQRMQFSFQMNKKKFLKWISKLYNIRDAS